jgi:hypothetical protein
MSRPICPDMWTCESNFRYWAGMSRAGSAARSIFPASFLQNGAPVNCRMFTSVVATSRSILEASNTVRSTDAPAISPMTINALSGD